MNTGSVEGTCVEIPHLQVGKDLVAIDAAKRLRHGGKTLKVWKVSGGRSFADLLPILKWHTPSYYPILILYIGGIITGVVCFSTIGFICLPSVDGADASCASGNSGLPSELSGAYISHMEHFTENICR